MKKFIHLIEEHLRVLNEEDPALPPADPTAAPVDPAAAPAPGETPESAIPGQEGDGQEDTAVLKVNYVEMIRKALIMAPKHIDDVDYAKLTKVVDTENLEEMQELVSRIVKNNYPHSDFEV